MVDIKGAVNKPGVYEMKQGDRIISVIERAQGFQAKMQILR
ncbi:SLBB domain-containing protein [Anaerobacillus sp. HL2]|nr:SLBB domain-containing protein [Anaerobacillus sp. HL2]